MCSLFWNLSWATTLDSVISISNDALVWRCSQKAGTKITVNPEESYKETVWAMQVWGLSGEAVPYLIFIIVHKEEPTEFHNQGATVGDGDVANDLGVIQDAAEVHLRHLKAEVGVMHFSTQAQVVHLRVLHILNW